MIHAAQIQVALSRLSRRIDRGPSPSIYGQNDTEYTIGTWWCVRPHGRAQSPGLKYEDEKGSRIAGSLIVLRATLRELSLWRLYICLHRFLWNCTYIFATQHNMSLYKIYTTPPPHTHTQPPPTPTHGVFNKCMKCCAESDEVLIEVNKN